VTDLVLGPMLRHVGERHATIWVEVDAPAEVEVLGHTASTFQVGGHHYALVVVEGLAPGSTTRYGVSVNGRAVWPPAGESLPPSVIRTLPPHSSPARLRLAFGSCRLALPHGPAPGRGHAGLSRRSRRIAGRADALRALALRVAASPHERWPDLLLLLGDQIYADSPGPSTRSFIRGRRDASRAPWMQVADFEEYARLYRETWSDPAVHWLLSTVPTAMIFDDHETCNDWNISAAWVADMRAQPWWEECITSGLASYWLYQHLGNLSPEELAADPVYREVLRAPDATGVLREHARRTHRGDGGWRSSHHRDLGGTRVVAINSRNARVLEPGRRAMLTEDEWSWADEHLTGGVDHLVVATSLPFALPHGAHHLEALSEALGDGAWGAPVARAAERLRRWIGLEHWAAFHASFNRLGALLEAVAEGRRGAAPGSIALLSGDVHYAYLAELLPARPDASPIYQAVCSPFRNELSARLRLATRLAFTAPMALALRALARLAGVEPDAVAWRILGGPHFVNQTGTLELEGRAARLRIERAVVGAGGAPRLEPLLEHRVAGLAPVAATVESPS
jgi:PhoD-like phosphatase